MANPMDRLNRAWVLLLAAALLLAAVPLGMQAATAGMAPGSYTNPVKPRMADGRVVESCPDPSVLRGRGRYAARWYMYCTTNPSTTVRHPGRERPSSTGCPCW